jgi:hypothetical protein
MREKMKRRMLTVLTGEHYSPSDAHRKLVVTLKLNDVTHDRIAACLGCSRVALEYFYSKELDFGVDAVLAHATERMLYLANQDADLGVSLRATQALLAPRVKSWREAQVDVTESIGDISDLTLAKVEDAIARLERQRRAAHATAGQAAGADPDQEEPA